MKRRDVLTTTAAIAFTGCIGGGGEGDTTDDAETETTGEPPPAGTDMHTGDTAGPTATDAGTETPRVVQKTERPQTRTTPSATNTATEPTTDGTPSSPIPIPDAPNGSRKRLSLTGEAHVRFENGGSRVVVTGTIAGQNGCQTAVLDSVRQTNSGLVITVATERDAPADAACSMALVEIDYRFVVRVETPPKSVTVVHRGVTGRRTVYAGDPNDA